MEELLLYVRVDGVSYLGRVEHDNHNPIIGQDKEIILFEPVIFEMINVPAQNPLTGQTQIAGMIQISHLHTDKLFIQLSFNYTYATYSMEDNTNTIVQLYKNSWANLRKQSKGVH